MQVTTHTLDLKMFSEDVLGFGYIADRVQIVMIIVLVKGQMVYYGWTI